MSVDPNHDYTQDDVPFGNVDDFALPNALAVDKTSEQIADENSFKPIPVGEHVLMVHSIPEIPQITLVKVMADGAIDSFESYALRVKLCLPDDPMSTIEDYFRCPPGNPQQRRAYVDGVAFKKDGTPGNGKPGFDANKFYNFIGAIGFDYPPGGMLPPEALILGNWKGRLVRAKVVPGTAYRKPGDTEDRQGRNQIGLFSYERVDPDTAASIRSSTKATPPSRPSQAARPAARAMAQAAVADSGVDDI
jgi:hypothetical protein